LKFAAQKAQMLMKKISKTAYRLGFAEEPAGTLMTRADLWARGDRSPRRLLAKNSRRQADQK